MEGGDWMYEYKFVKYVFPADAVLHGSFEVSYAEEHDGTEYFGYHQVIKEYAKDGWRLNSIVPFTDPEVKEYFPKGLDLVFERKQEN